MHHTLCEGKPGLCDAMKPTKGTELLKYLRKVSFEGKYNVICKYRKHWKVRISFSPRTELCNYTTENLLAPELMLFNFILTVCVLYTNNELHKM